MSIAIPVAVVLLAWTLTRALAAGRGILVLDHPNERSLHDRPTPRTGGIAIVVAGAAGLVALALAGAGQGMGAWTLAAAAVLFAVSLGDDVWNLPAGLRLLVHVLCALAALQDGLRVESLLLPGTAVALPAVLDAIVTVLLLVWMTNLYNFMDGMDGFAGGMGVIGFAAMAIMMAGSASALAMQLAVVAAACAGFLCVNFPPARIFMGDAGSSVLGYLAGCSLLALQQTGGIPLWLGLLVFSPFIVDATVTLLRRALAGEAIWRAHRSHFYQRVVALGLSHRRTVLWEYLLMLACATGALLAPALTTATQWLLLWGVVALYAILMLCIRRLEAVQSST